MPTNELGIDLWLQLLILITTPLKKSILLDSSEPMMMNDGWSTAGPRLLDPFNSLPRSSHAQLE